MQFELKLSYEFPFEGNAFNISKSFFKAYSDGKTLKVEIIPKLSAETIEEFNKTLSLIEQIGKIWLDKALEEIFKTGPAQTIDNYNTPEEIKLTDNSEKIDEKIDIGLPEEETTLKTPAKNEGKKEEKKEETEEIPLADLIEANTPEEIDKMDIGLPKFPKEENKVIETEQKADNNPTKESSLTDLVDFPLPEKEIKQNLEKKEQKLELDEGKKEEIPLVDLIDIGLPEEETTLKTSTKQKTEKEGGEEIQPPFRGREGEEESIENFLSEEERRILEETFKSFQEKFKGIT